ncbi:cytochrome P450 78A3 [Microthyrium microscopicum]|uniref:Cytochrome P450 78A3 n=1 Tax=Microthyrium microscopicum TaxID=703497 RepID=A0A6A6UEB8_9PEZI|nr:cytochrome P450 78A3 [Microthyrium microscopicum]
MGYLSITYAQLFYICGALSFLQSRGFLPGIALQSGSVSSWFRAFLILYVLSMPVLFAFKAFVYPFFLSPLRNLPAPKGGNLLFGHFPTIMREPSGAPMARWADEVPNNGIMRYNHIFNSQRVLLTSPKALQEVLSTKSYQFIKPSFFRLTIGRLLGNGILFAEGDEHRRQRKLLNPAFSFRHIKELYPTFWSKGQEVTEAMSKHIDNNQTGEDSKDGCLIDINDWASRVTLDIIGVAGMGHDFNVIKDPSGELNTCYRHVFNIGGGNRVAQLMGFFLPTWLTTRLPLKRNQDIIAARHTIRKISFELIAQKRAALEKGSTGTDILSVAIESGGFSDEDLANQLMTFLAAGHETTASAMAWACYHLCQHPEVQSRLREEIRANLPSLSDPESTITSASIDKLPYLNAVCNEVLRVYPSVPLTIRIAKEDDTILGHFIPKDTAVVVCPWSVNVNEELWGPDAKIFNPDRWMGPGRAKTGGADSHYSFLTFLDGPRGCIGRDFAKAEFACLLATWVGRFEIEFGNKDYVLEIGGGITSKPKKDMAVRMRNVEGW